MDGVDRARLHSEETSKQALRTFVIRALEASELDFKTLDDSTIDARIPITSRLLENLDVGSLLNA